MQFVCLCCNKIFQDDCKITKYCSWFCYEQMRFVKIEKCMTCKNLVRLNKQRYEKSKNKEFFCCIKCRNKFYRGNNNPNYGNHVLAGSNNPNYSGGKYKQCLVCDKNFWVTPSLENIRRTCSWRCKTIYETGKNSNGYIHGNWKRPYPKVFNGELKKLIHALDNYKCLNCSMTELQHQKRFGQSLHVHHIDYNKENCQIENLITACRSCNSKFNHNREKWMKQLLIKTKGRG